MAQRDRKKVKRAPVRRASRPARKPDEVGIEARLRALSRERDQLKVELDGARTRIAALESQCAQVVNRIDWIIDSLHNVMEGEA